MIAANRADTESIVPLLAYFRLHADLGQKVPEAALLGMLKVIKLAPSAPGPRLDLGRELIRQGMADQARRILLPVATSPYDTPERAEAAALLRQAGSGGAAE